MEGLTRTLAKERGRLNTIVNAVAFGLFSTRLTKAADDGATIDVRARRSRSGSIPSCSSGSRR